MDEPVGADDPSPPSEHLGPASIPTDDGDQGTKLEPEVTDVRKDRPPSPEERQSADIPPQDDKSEVEISSVDSAPVWRRKGPPESTEEPENTSEAFSTDPPPVPPRKRRQNLSHRKGQGEKKNVREPETKSVAHKQGKSDDESSKTSGVSPTKGSEDSDSGVRLKKELGLLDGVGLTVGVMIGSGIFVSPRAVLQYTGSVGMSLAVWALTGLVSMVGALCYAELGTMIPESGGDYTYLHETFGPLPAFLYLWMFVLITVPSSRAIGALTFANYILKPFFPECQEPPQSAIRIVGVLLILLLTWINSRRVKWATSVQDILAMTKILALVMIIIVGLTHLARGRSQNFDDPMAGTNWDPSSLATAFYHTLFAYAGWNNLNNIMEELKDPSRNLPRAIAFSITSVMVIYMLTNIAYFAVLSPDQMLASVAVAVTFGSLVLGVMAWTIPIFVACSTSGSLNGAVFSSSRVLFVSSRRGHLPKMFSFVHVENYTPVISLAFTAGITMIMFVTSDVRVLINYISFADNIFGLGCIGSFFWYRIKQPDRPRPIKIWIGFPVIFFITSLFLVMFPVVRQPVEIVAALIIIATGLPVYYLAVHRKDKPQPLVKAIDKVTYLCQLLFQAVPEAS